MVAGPSPMHYCELPPAPALRPWVAYYWHFRVASGNGERLHRVPPDGGAMLFYAERQAVSRATGPHLKPLEVTVGGGDVYWGVRFWPGAAGALLDLGELELRERGVAAETCAPGWAKRAHETLRGRRDPQEVAPLLDRLVAALLPPRHRLDPEVMHAVFRILRSRGRQAIASVVAATGLSASQLRRRFRRATGLTPKELARIRRFRETAIDVVTGHGAHAWVDLAAEHGYADQAHLVHEFRRFIGLSPGSFRAEFDRIDHGRLYRPGGRDERFLQDDDDPRG